MTTQIAIINRALGHLGTEPIASLNDNTVPAQTAALYYDAAKKDLFQLHYWNFSDHWTTLTNTIDSFTHPHYEFKFLIPSDNVRIMAAFDEFGRPIDYGVVGKYILANVDEIYLNYNQLKVENEFPAFFTNILEMYLAFKMCFKITEDANRSGVLYKLFREMFDSAKSIDSAENAKTSFLTDDNSNLLRGRFNY